MLRNRSPPFGRGLQDCITLFREFFVFRSYCGGTILSLPSRWRCLAKPQYCNLRLAVNPEGYCLADPAGGINQAISTMDFLQPGRIFLGKVGQERPADKRKTGLPAMGMTSEDNIVSVFFKLFHYGRIVGKQNALSRTVFGGLPLDIAFQTGYAFEHASAIGRDCGLVRKPITTCSFEKN